MSGTESETSRSSTPVTDLSGWCPSSNGSSFASSVPPDTDCDCTSKSGKNDAGALKSDRGSPPGKKDGKDDKKMDDTASKAASNPDLSRHSQLRHATSARSSTSDVSIASTSGPESEVAADDDDEAVADDDDDDNDWSGEDESLDAAIIAAVNGDLGLAAFLIPILHRDLRNLVRSKVDSWQIDPVSLGPSTFATGEAVDGEGGRSNACGSGSGASAAGSARSQDRGLSASQARKRRRRISESEEERDNGDDEQDGNGGDDVSRPEPLQDIIMPLLACPFHKRNPSKYGIQHNVTANSRKDGYRACAGPGFKSIQRLKEHLKRKHTPVQCDRCYRIFDGADKASCINELTDHRRHEVPCEKGDPSLKEGISEAQWAALDKQNRKKNQEKHKVDKWFEIWHVLFPDVLQPSTPWYAEAMPTRLQTPSRESEEFSNLFLHILNHKVQQGDFSFPGCNLHEVQQWLGNTVQQTFRTYVSLHGPLSRTTDTSSSQTGTGTNIVRSSLVGGSSTHQSHPTDGTSQMPLTTTSRSTPTLMTQQQLQPPPQPAQPLPQQRHQVGQYALGVAGAGAGVQYMVPNMAMNQRRNGAHNLPYGAVTSSSVLPAQTVAGSNIGAPMPAGNYSLNQEELTGYYNVQMAWPAQAGLPYGAAPMSAVPFNQAAAGHQQLHQPEFYSQVGGFGSGQDDGYGNLQ
ncbi:hypothetical protein SPI_06558 [Niveomyces insectorum RCEF 264]|uniref:C2H2-type domain-containing protein n=1 Tax=Niveomyces insectorum RCEF 264 TaxID=1081102 RepID=A0A167RDC4_9HYPO|nr:hypothetical protein SPI_06558 [Niveomyces insectorum RCEF 264]